jgi:hypothetical protein
MFSNRRFVKNANGDTGSLGAEYQAPNINHSGEKDNE